MRRLWMFLARCSWALGGVAFTLAALALTLSGCMGRQRYIEGTHLALGAYIPGEEGLYGVEIVQYTSGAYLSTATNTPCSFCRTYSATNSYLWGMVQTVESTRTKLEVEKED